MTQSTTTPSSVADSAVKPVGTVYRPKQRTRLEVLGRWSFIIPILLLNLIVVVIPTIFSIYVAFTEWSGFGSPVFNGLVNFKNSFRIKYFSKHSATI
jgi:ABC-type sugar transport system permease subunit